MALTVERASDESIFSDFLIGCFLPSLFDDILFVIFSPRILTSFVWTWAASQISFAICFECFHRLYYSLLYVFRYRGFVSTVGNFARLVAGPERSFEFTRLCHILCDVH